MMSLSALSIKKPVFAWMIMVGLIVFGGISFFRMGISQLPDVDFPVINIGLTLNNAAPEIMESDVVDRVEDAVMGIEGIRSVASTSSQGSANITVEFDLDRNIDVALQEVQTRVSQTQRRLPSKLDPPVITKTNPEDQPILWIMLTSDGRMPLYQQMIYARNTLKNQFSIIKGVGSVLFGGYVDPNLRVWLSEKKLYRYAFTAQDITASIEGEQLEEPAGRIENDKNEINVRLLGEALNPEQFGKIRINQRGGAPNYIPLQLHQVARIEEGLTDVRAISRYNGKPAVGLGIIKQRGANAVEVAREVRAKVEKVRASLPVGMSLNVQLDTTKYIEESISELNFTLLLAAIFTSIVCFLFLGSLSSTINVLLAIPTSIIGTFVALYFFGFTLNTFTLLGLSLAIGIVVDDAIMMLENIVRHAEGGEDKVTAALRGSEEITFAALAATLAIAAIFVPVIFMKGIIGKFFYQYGITVTVAVFLSLLEALTLTPMRCAQFLKVNHGENANRFMAKIDRFMAFLADKYRNSLEWILNLRGPVLLCALVFFLGSLALVGFLRKELIPEQDQSLFLMTLQTPVGTSLMATNEDFKKAEVYLARQPEVLEVYTTIGNYLGQDITNTGQIYITLKEAKSRKLTQRQIMDRTREELKTLLPQDKIFAQDLSLSGFSASKGFPIEFTVQGPDWNKLVILSKEIMRQVQATGLVTDLNTDYQDGMPEVQILPDRDLLASHGVSLSNIGSEISTLIGGQIFTSSTQYPKDGHRYDIRVRSEPSDHDEAADLNKIYVRTNRGTAGELVPLRRLVKVEERPTLQMISRFNRERAFPIYAGVAVNQSQQSVLEKIKEIGVQVLPKGYHISFTGSAETFKESFSSLIFALLLGILVSYMVLASQFNSFIHPVTVLLALPFSLSGAFVALFLTHQSLNLFSMIGLILLMGIVKKNSILLVDFTNQCRSHGGDVRAALLEACPVRLRPILMTSIATIAGAIPAALAFGPGAETRIPMAVCLIGGVLISTLLTLFVVPCAYSVFAKFERREESDLTL